MRDEKSGKESGQGSGTAAGGRSGGEESHRPENGEARKRKSSITPNGKRVPETTSGTRFFTAPERTEGRAGRPHLHRHRKTTFKNISE